MLDLSRIRQQVIRLLSRHQGNCEAKDGRTKRRPGKASVQQRGLPAEVLERVESIDSQWSAIGQRLCAGPDTRNLDQQIAQARRDKEAAADEKDYESAAALRDQERHLLADKTARQQEWAAAHLDLASLTAELHRLGADVGQLRDLPRRQGIDPQSGAA